MSDHCRFLSEEFDFEGAQVRVLGIYFEDGFSSAIFVTKGEEVVGGKPSHNVWHYEISGDLSGCTYPMITLKNFHHSSSVDFLNGIHHVWIENWPLFPEGAK